VKIFLVGIGCVGKTTVGSKLATRLALPYFFFDLDDEVEKFFSTPIERLQDRLGTVQAYRQETSKALDHLLHQAGAMDAVIALPASGLMKPCWGIVKKANGIVIALEDKAENILNRITFFDKDSVPIKKVLTDEEKRLYLREIKLDITYFKPSYKKAHLTVNMAGLDADMATEKVEEMLDDYLQTKV
jgi:shikimate kinase